jgi:enoyl-[acyl-carrier protein] reductase I
MLRGKVALITGVANKHSIAWAVADAWRNEGASVIIMCQSSRFLNGIEKLTQSWNSLAGFENQRKLTLCADFCNDKEIDGAFLTITKVGG